MPLAIAGRLKGSEPLRVVLFSGGRGSAALARQLVSNPTIDLSIVINGYDDGASTGEVRRFLGDCLGPSDFRKNASNLAGALCSCPPELRDLLDLRLPSPYPSPKALACLDAFNGTPAGDAFAERARRLFDALPEEARTYVAARLWRFGQDVRATGTPFKFDDCSLGNLVFAGAFLFCHRDFNRTVDDYVSLVGLRPGLIENVTDGTNAHLVAVDADGRLLATEEAIVDTQRPNRLRDIFLVDRMLGAGETAAIERGTDEALSVLRQRQATLRLNPRVAEKIASAALIIYGPGTQHSSLFPSYLTPGLGEAVATNLGAMKVLVTNLRPDAEITGSSAVDLVNRAAFYLRAKDAISVPAPFLITHSLLNDPASPETGRPYVPLGATEAIEDPRLVRIGNFEEGATGRHHAVRVLEPFIASIVSRRDRRRVAVLLTDAVSLNKVAQTLLEMVRGGVERLPIDVTVFHTASEPLHSSLTSGMPFAIQHVPGGERAFVASLREGTFDYVLLFESSGMYRGEEIVPILGQLVTGRLDAVWGSRRLSVRDIEQSYRFRYSGSLLRGAVSYIGSYALSLACLLLYGRYMTDTLSGVRAVRAVDALDPSIDLIDRNTNHVLLARLLSRKAEMLEIPVRFVPMDPERVKRPTVAEGLGALTTLLVHRFRAQPAARAGAYESRSATAGPRIE